MINEISLIHVWHQGIKKSELKCKSSSNKMKRTKKYQREMKGKIA